MSQGDDKSNNPSVPTLMRAVYRAVPRLKLMVVFRNPVERAMSEYAYFTRDEAKVSGWVGGWGWVGDWLFVIHEWLPVS